MTVAKNEHTSRRKNHRSDSSEAPPVDEAAEATETQATETQATEMQATETQVETQATEMQAAQPEPNAEDAKPEAAEMAPAAEMSDAASESESAAPQETLNGRDRIQQQLEQLKQREAELRRELAMADHPGLADAIRQIEGRAYGVARVEAKMAQGLSKSELRKKETIEKKLNTAKERRAEIDAQIAALELELAPLGEERVLAFQKERAEALLRLVSLLSEHEPAIAAANLELSTLVPALAAWRAEIDALRTMA